MDATLQMIIDNLKAIVLPFLIALPFVLLSRWLLVKKKNNINRKREVFIVIFLLYLCVVLSQTIIPESLLHFDFSVNPYHFPNRKNTIVFFTSQIGWIQWKIKLGDFADVVRNIGGNILLFIPYGILFPCCYPKLRRYTLLFGLLLSLFIEFTQLFFDRVTDINDIILNVCGMLIGYLLYWLVRAIVNSIKNKKAVSRGDRHKEC